jgi:hypothetical protein
MGSPIDALEIASAVFAIFAAALWLASSRVETRREFPIKITSWHTYDGEEVTGAQVVGEGSGTSENLEALARPRGLCDCVQNSLMRARIPHNGYLGYLL